jgi:hypothetical protein
MCTPSRTPSRHVEPASEAAFSRPGAGGVASETLGARQHVAESGRRRPGARNKRSGRRGAGSGTASNLKADAAPHRSGCAASASSLKLELKARCSAT